MFHKQTRLKCIFGCTDKPDCTFHYILECEALWDIIGKATKCDLAGLIPKLGAEACITDSGLLHFACAFNVYHVLVERHPDLGHGAQISLSFDAHLETALVVARAIVSDWSERPRARLAR